MTQFTEKLQNSTSTIIDATDIADDEGRSVLVVVSKLAFRFDREGRLRLAARAIRSSDVLDDAGGLRYPSDYSLPFPGTDCVLVGTAHPGPTPAESRLVSMRVGPVKKAVRLFGPRVYMSTPRGVRPGPSANIVKTPLRYDFVFGGSASLPGEPDSFERDPHNPLGRGFALAPDSVLGKEAHRLEPEQPVGLPPSAACFAPIDVNWEPRRGFMGTYDDAWSTTRAPIPPRDRDPRFHSCARPEQRSDAALTLPFPIDLQGFVGDEATSLSLPAYGIRVVSELHGGTGELHDASLDRVLVDVDERVVELSFVAHVPLPMKWEKLRTVRVLAVGSLPDDLKHREATV